jgi:hypothetical protein
MSTSPGLPRGNRRWKRWLQFRLRTFLMLTVAVAAALGIAGLRVKSARDQQVAVAALRQFGATITYDTGNQQIGQTSLPRGAILGVRAPNNPQLTWLERLFGEDFFSKVTEVTFPTLGQYFRRSPSAPLLTLPPPVGDRQLAHVAKLPYLEVLVVSSDQVTDAALEHLADLANLRDLHLVNTSITDEGLARLLPRANLEELDLSGTKVTDNVLVQLQDVRTLRVLVCRNTAVTREGMNRFRQVRPKTWTAY